MAPAQKKEKIVKKKTESKKKTAKEILVEKEIVIEDKKTEIKPEDKEDRKEKYFQAVGRRKEAVAIVRLFTKKSNDKTEEDKALINVNGKDYVEFFRNAGLRDIVESPLKKLKSIGRFKATVLVRGGGITGQADAIKHGLSRTLIMFDANFRKKLKKSGFLTRDPRVKERRKYGLKKARKSPQWQKR